VEFSQPKVLVQCLDEVVKDVAGLVQDCKFSGLGSITGCSIWRPSMYDVSLSQSIRGNRAQTREVWVVPTNNFL
jgi:hypothetical protein